MAEFSARMMSSLSYLSSNLLDQKVSDRSLPTIAANGTEITDLKQLSATMGVDQQTAALYVLESKDHPLQIEALAEFENDPLATATIDSYVRKIINLKPEEKRVRLVRSVYGARRFGQPRGSIIVTDGQAPINNIRAVRSDIAGYDKVADTKGNFYYIGVEGDRWVVRVPGQKAPLFLAKTDKDAYTKLSQIVASLIKKKV